jgi:peptidoglycan LD-endopeptidase CwlK
MSLQLFKQDILFFQRVLSVSGFYSGPLNGKWNAETEAANIKFDSRSSEIRAQFGEFDKRTERNIETLIPPSQALARRFMQKAGGFAFPVRIISGTRTYAEQDALFAIGRTTQLNRSPVTKAKGGQSNHNFSIAWDVGIFSPQGEYFDGNTKSEQRAYADLATLIKSAIPELEWGGDWTGFQDPPHYQVRTGKTTKEVRDLFEKGKPFI